MATPGHGWYVSSPGPEQHILILLKEGAISTSPGQSIDETVTAASASVNLVGGLLQLDGLHGS